MTGQKFADEEVLDVEELDKAVLDQEVQKTGDKEVVNMNRS